MTSAAFLAVGTAAQADDVNITTSTNNGFVLDGFAGTTARVLPGVTVSNTTFNFNCPIPPGPSMSLAGVCASTRAWTLTNQGTIGPTNPGDGVAFYAGGSVINAGNISGGTNGITIQGGAGGSVDNQLGATINGSSAAIIISGVAGTVNNAGTISNAVLVTAGGTLTNLTGATISTTGAGNTAVTMRGGASRAVTNDGTISSTGTGFATGVEIGFGTGVGHLTNQSNGTIFGTYNGVFAAASVILDLTNNGHIQSTNGPGVEARGGGTFVNTGLIESANDGLFIAGTPAASVTNSGTIRSTGAGRAIAFSGNATHTLTLGTGSVLGGNVQGGTGTDNLVLSGTGTESIAKFLSFETLTMQGSDWSLTGTGTFNTTTVTSGTLRVNGTLTSPTVTVASGGTLGGAGTVVGATTVNGTIAPGNSIGTLNITGNYTQAAGSTYLVEVSPAPASDLINITGTATIQAGAAVNVVGAPGMYTVGQRYTILTAAGGRTGTYATLADNLPFVDFQLAYDANNVFLDVSSATVAFQDVAQTPNQRAAAGGAQSLGAGNSLFNAITMLDTPNALRAFDLISGEVHASAGGTLIEDSRFLRDAIGGRLRQFGSNRVAPSVPGMMTLNFAGESENPSFADAAFAYAPRRTARSSARAPTVDPRAVTAWTQGFGNWGRTPGDGNAATLGRATGGFVTGIDVTAPGEGIAWATGLAGGVQRSSLSVDDRNSSATIESRHLAAYGALQNGPAALRAGASYGRSDISTSRTIVFPGFADTARASYAGRTAQVFGEAAYGLGAYSFAFEPFAGLAYVNIRTEGFTEAGGAAALTAAGNSMSTTYSTLGLRAAVPLPVALPGDALLMAKASLGWRHAFGTTTPTAQLSFAGASWFTVAGVPLTRDAATLELGLDGRLSRNDTLGVSYTGQMSDAASDHGITAHYTHRF